MILIKNAWLVTLNREDEVVKDGAVVIVDNLITEIGLTKDLSKKYPDVKTIDAHGKVVLPGMINTHMHLYSTFSRGLALPDEAPKNFLQILERLWWRLDKQLTLEDVYYSALIPLLDCLRSGTTTIIDHHASPFAVSGSLQTIGQAVLDVGLRASLSYEVSDRDGPEVSRQGIEENIAFIKTCQKDENSLLTGLFGLHASFTLSDQTLIRCRKAIEGLSTGFHIHTAEGLEDVADSLNRSGLRVVERLDQFGIWNEKSLAIHCIHLNQTEMEILRERGTAVVHNPQSNMGNGVGCADIERMIKTGLVVGLGTDGFTTDMFESLKVANILHKHELKDPSAFFQEIPQMALVNNRSILGKYFPRPLGQLVPGGYADLLITDYDPPTPLDENSYYGHLLFGLSASRILTTIVNGRILMKERQIQGIDLEKVHAYARELARKLWVRF